MSLMSPRRWFVALAALALPFALSPASTRAEDDEPSDPMSGDPEAGGNKVTSFAMVLEKDGLPEGFTIVEGEAAGPDAKALEEAVNAIAKDKGVATSDDYSVLMRSAAGPAGVKAHYAYVDLGAPSQTFVDALKAEGAKKSWSVRAMGTERHVLVTAAPEAARAKAEGFATAFAGRMLTRRAVKSLESDGRRALGLSRIALQLDAKSAGAHFILGLIQMQLALRAKPIGNLEPAITHFRAGLDKDATNALSKREAVIATGKLGQSILNKGGPSAEARDLLKATVASLSELTPAERTDAVGFRYDLACAHGRLKEVDDAFKVLSSVLEDDAKDPVQGISEIWREKDTDLDSLRADPRWKALLEKYPDTSAGTDK